MTLGQFIDELVELKKTYGGHVPVVISDYDTQMCSLSYDEAESIRIHRGSAWLHDGNGHWEERHGVEAVLIS